MKYKEFTRDPFFPDAQFCILSINEDMKQWLEGSFVKICVTVESEQELLDLRDKADKASIPFALITDSGLTYFKNVPTNTVLAIGPANSEKIDLITGHLKLY